MSAKILLIDDEEMLRNLYKEFMEIKQCTVRAAKSCEDALNHLQDFVPDLIICDIKMPGTDGIETLKLLKNHNRYRKFPVVMLTAVNEVESIKQCLAFGALGYVVKIGKPDQIYYQLQLFLKAIMADKFAKSNTAPLRVV
ncbi:MAG: response regulator [Thermodesulfobacteriota bacterium]